MSNIFLSRILNGLEINNYFKNLNEINKNYFKEEINILGSQGSLPYMYWNSERNNNFGKGLLYNDIVKFQQTLHIPISINCANVLIESKDYFDTYANIVLSLLNNGGNFLEISNLDFLEYLHNKYPYYYFILSEQFFLFNPETSIDFNVLTYIKYCKCSFNSSLINSNIPKNKLLLCLNNICTFCENYNECTLRNQGAQYTYSTFDSQNNCDIFQKTKNNILNEKIQEMKEKGINNFYIQDNFSNNLEYILFLSNLLVKEEYRTLILQDLNKIGVT